MANDKKVIICYLFLVLRNLRLTQTVLVKKAGGPPPKQRKHVTASVNTESHACRPSAESQKSPISMAAEPELRETASPPPSFFARSA